MANPLGVVFYDGPSMIDGKPIIAVATFSSSNRKTGDMVQTWILRRNVDPVRALRVGADASVCGGCYHRGDKATGRPRTCYVNIGQAPQSVWRGFHRGIYPKGTLQQTEGRAVRMGAYGDPVAVPWQAWSGIHGAKLWTGYTHQWRSLLATPFRNVLMASCDSVAEAAEAARAGWRTFLVDATGKPPEDSIECPSEKGTRCADCGLCSGLQRSAAPSIWIAPHGSAKRFVGAMS